MHHTQPLNARGSIHVQTRRAILAAGAASLLALAGCGGGATVNPTGTPYPVTGKVILPDGNPLTEGTVRFVPKGTEGGWPAAGKVKSDGAFSMTTYKEDDGVIPGTYLVAIESSLDTDAGRVSRPVVPSKYVDESLSGLEVTVKAETNTLEPFQLDDKKPVVSTSTSNSPRSDRDD